MREPKTFFVRTYGCQMNELDSELMVGALEKRGLSQVHNEQTADLIIFNTCSIRDLAERKAMGTLGKLGRKEKGKKIIGVTGCMANAKKGTLFHKLPHIDFVLGTNNIHDLNNVLDEVIATGGQTLKADDQFNFELDYLSAKRDDKLKAFVSIIRGCDKYCTYCVVPYTRGPESSRTPESIVDECKMLVDNGYKEVMLLGQNVNSFGKDRSDSNCLFHDLLYKLDQISGLERIRFMTSHPVDITPELMVAVRDLPSVCEFIHFPLQAGSNRILKKMHRIYTLEQYLEKVYQFKEILPTVTLGTDIIVGFPTETDEEFQMTYDALKQLEFSVAYIFAYSPRKGTPAMRWKDDVPEEVKNERVQALMTLQNEIYAKQRELMLGTEVEILVEGSARKDPRMLKGRTRCWKNVIFEGNHDLIGTLQNVKVHSFLHQTLFADQTEREQLLIS